MLEIPVPQAITGGFASEFNQEELALLLQHIQVFECRNNAGLCLWFGVTLLIVFGCEYPFTQDLQESRVFECLPHFGSGMGVLLES